MPAPTPATAGDVVAVASKLFTFIRTPAGEPYAIPQNGLHRALPLAQIVEDLAAAFLDSNDIPSMQVMAAGMQVIGSFARRAETREVHLRLAHLDGVTYLDLGTADGAYVEIRPGRWKIRYDECPVLFTRTDDFAALPIPERGGSRRALADLLALSTSDSRFRLAWGWLVAQMLPHVARPLLYLVGSQGSGKTTRGLLIANVLEPQAELGLLKKSERENNVTAKSSFILTADNLTKVSEDVSNWLCSLVTGAKVKERLLYTNAQTISYSIKRSGIFTGKVKPRGLESDAAERMVFLEFGRMPEGQTRADDDLLADLHKAHPRILGALLSDMAAALLHLPDLTPQDAGGYRFAKYGMVHAALDRIDSPGYVDALLTEAADALTETIPDTPDLLALLRVVARAGGSMKVTAADLLAAMNPHRPANAGQQSGPWWPATGEQLGTRLRNQQEALRKAGLTVEFGREGKARTRVVLMSMTADAIDTWKPPASIADIEIINQRKEATR
ncbi:hypothetical protein [Micromonospora tulbaghiae]|uniref:hypothetical protein n=1 Tax=Micromonospora tulbaghiae TaxID=479978 RepID=UPI003EC0EE07